MPPAAAGLARLPCAAQDPCVSAENYPEEEQRELSHLCACQRHAKEASVTRLHVERFCLWFDGLPTFMSVC